jgi:hypothetical protein
VEKTGPQWTCRDKRREGQEGEDCSEGSTKIGGEGRDETHLLDFKVDRAVSEDQRDDEGWFVIFIHKLFSDSSPHDVSDHVCEMRGS